MCKKEIYKKVAHFSIVKSGENSAVIDSIVTNERYRERTLGFLKGEKVLNVEKDLISLTLTYAKDFLHTPGVVFNVVRNIAWENINIFEIVSTNTELTVILHKKDAVKGYRALEKLVRR